MNHNELLVGLEERFDAVGHDIRLRSMYDDGRQHQTGIYCNNCLIEACVATQDVGGWSVKDGDGQTLLPVLDERCTGTVTPDILVSRFGVWQEALEAVKHDEEAADQALAALDAAEYAYSVQQQSVNA